MKRTQPVAQATRHGYALTLLLLAGQLYAQPGPALDRIRGRIDSNQRVVLKGNRSPKAEARLDEGPIEASMPMRGMMMQVKRSAAQQAELEQLLQDQENPDSPKFHAWLTPEDYADRFGASPTDLAAVESWLKAQGFRIDLRSRSRTWIAFSGDARQVASAFRTEIHRYRVEGELHFANAGDPSIPAALEPVVAMIQGLDDFRMTSGRRVRLLTGTCHTRVRPPTWSALPLMTQSCRRQCSRDFASVPLP